MELVIDANILFAALIAKGKTRELIFDDNLILYAPEHMLGEFNKHLDELSAKTHLTKDTLKKLIEELLAYGEIRILPQQEIQPYLKKAAEFTPDPADAPYSTAVCRQKSL